MTVATVIRKYTFSAAHYLPQVPEGHKCGRVHGHNYTVVVSCRGEIDRALGHGGPGGGPGWVIDFADIDARLDPVLRETFDHQSLNDVVANPTAENVALFIAGLLQVGLHGTRVETFEVEVWETERAGARVGPLLVIGVDGG